MAALRFSRFHTAAILSSLVGLASPAMAQTDADQLAELRECARVQIDRARWNCFDGVFADDAESAAARPTEQRGEASPAAAAPAADAPPAAEPAATRAEPAAAVAAASRVEPVPGAARAAEAAAEEPARSTRNRRRNVEVEPEPEPEPEDEGPWIVTVVEMFPRARGNLRFVTSDGEVLTQPYGERKGFYPDVPFEAELEAGRLGGFFIKPLERGPRTRVSLEP